MTTRKKAPKYAVVDLEATGTSSDAKIIQVGIVLVQEQEILSTYQTDVNPHQPLSEHIRQLTGITNAQLKKAPDFSQVAREIYELIEDAIFVAHNVKFDANLLAEALFFEGYELRTPRVDTVELAQVFFPTLDKYSLGQLTSYLGIDLQHAHTAIADAYATAELLIKIQDKIRSLPQQTVEQILTWGDDLIYESRLVIDEMLAQTSPMLPRGLEVANGLVLRKQYQYSKPRHLSQDFETNLALLGLEPRPSQTQFAEMLAAHVDSQLPYFLQAQSGMGKTFGYLLTYLAKCPDEKLVVTVPTKLLQDQIMAQEARQIGQVFHTNFHSLKGPANYLKLDAFYESLQSLDDNRLVNRLKMQLLVWLLETETGDLDEIKQQQRFPSFFEQLQHDGNLPADTLFKGNDFWEWSYQRAQDCQVLITNHAYFLTRVEDDKAFVAGKRLVIDEAQKLFLNLENFSHKYLSIKQTLQEIQHRLDRESDLLTKRLLESVQFSLNQLIPVWHKTHQVPAELLAQLRQDLAELQAPELVELAQALDERYQEYWLEFHHKADHREAILGAARLDFLNFGHFLPENCQVVAISATLVISRTVNVAQVLGFEDYQFDQIPVSIQHKQGVWALTDSPDVSDLNTEEYARFIAEQVADLTRLGSPQLVLFQSNAALSRTSEWLTEWGIDHLAQQETSSNEKLKRRFEAGESKILLGSVAFWEGVDFAEMQYLLLVITRIPFDNPKSVFSKKIHHYFKQNGLSSFYEYTLPMAIVKLKQAMGRSTRRQEQVSAVVLLDNRLLTKRYGKQIVQAISQHRKFYKTDQAQLVAELQKFFH